MRGFRRNITGSQILDANDKVLYGVFDNLVAEEISLSDGYAAENISFEEESPGIYIYSEVAAKVRVITGNLTEKEVYVPAEVFYSLPVTVKAINAKAANSGESGNLHISGWF